MLAISGLFGAVTQPKTTWRAPERKTKANAIDLEDSDTENPQDAVAPTALDEDQEDNMQVDNEGSKPADAGGKITHTPPTHV